MAKGESELKHKLRSRLGAIALLAILMLSGLPVLILPVHASGPTVNHVVTNFATNSATVSGVLTVDLAADVIYVATQAIDGVTAHVDIHSTGVGDGGDTFTEQVFKTVTIGLTCAAGNCYHSAIWSATAATAGSKTVTVTYDHATSSGQSLTIQLWDTTGFGPTAAATATGSSTGTTSITTSSSNAFIAPALAIGSETGCVATSPCVPGTSYTLACFGGIGSGGCAEYSTTVASPTNYPFSEAAATNWTDSGAVFASLINMVVTIMNFDLGNYLVVQLKKYYNFNETVIGINHAKVDIVKWKWTDGANIAEVQYSNLTKTATVLQGNNIIIIGTPTATSSIVSGQRRLQVIIPVILSDSTLDAVNVGIQAFAQDSDGVSRGYIFVRNNYFNILNQGGSTSQIISGTCAQPFGPSGYFSWLCQDRGWVMLNTTWFQLQQYHTEFAINLNDNNGIPDVFLFQDAAHNGGGTEDFTAKGNWKVDIGWFYFNNGNWMKGFHVTLQMQQGNQGTQDQWTQVNALYYNGKNTLLRNDTFDVWIEQSPRSQIRLWVDLWISDLNASSFHGIRIGAYYYAIHQSGFTFFGSWSPFLQNASSTIGLFKNPNTDTNVGTLSAQQIKYSKLYWNISRTTHPIGQSNFQIFTKDFNLEEFKTTNGPMGGLNTPIFVDAKIPTLPPDGFFAPIYAAIASIGNFIWTALSGAFAAIWAQIGIRFPWFTGFFDTVSGNVTGFASLFVSILGQLGGFLTFLVSIFNFVTAPIQIVLNTWTFLSNAFNSVFPGASLGQMVTLFIIVVFGLSFFEAAMTGDWPWIIRFARQTWAIVNAIMFYTFKFARLLIDAILAIIP